MQNKKQIIVADNNVGNFRQVSCPVCGYRMPIFFSSAADCKGLYVTCKGRGCKHRFEISVENGKQEKRF